MNKITFVNHIINNLVISLHTQTLHSTLQNKYIPENKTHTSDLKQTKNAYILNIYIFIYLIAVQESNMTKQIILVPLICVIQV